MNQYTKGIDSNGNSVVIVKPPGARAFRIQTLGNMPTTHRRGIAASWTPGEVNAYVRDFGTKSQKEKLGL